MKGDRDARGGISSEKEGREEPCRKVEPHNESPVSKSERTQTKNGKFKRGAR